MNRLRASGAAAALFAGGVAAGYVAAPGSPPPIAPGVAPPGVSWPHLGRRCDGADADDFPCGRWVYDGGAPAPVCVERDVPRAEVCDGFDNDCDGRTDEEVCP